MRFKTASGTEYELTDITAPKKSVHFTLGMYSGRITRRGDAPLTNVGLEELPEMQDAQECLFQFLPRIGESFTYIHETSSGCVSTPVVEINE